MIWSPLPLRDLREVTVDALNFAAIPLFMAVFEDEGTRRRAIKAFLAATILILLISFLLWSGLVQHLPRIKGSPAYPIAFKYHITHNFFMAIAVLFWFLLAHRSRGLLKLIYFAGSGLAAFNVFFMIPGRTGQLALAVAGFYVAYSCYRWRGLAAVMIISLIMATITWLTPDSVMHQRAAVAWQEASVFRAEGVARDDSSIGLRLEFYRNALKMFSHRPLLGTGTGGFESGYAQEVSGKGMVVAHHPHNAFLLMAAELGVIGLASLLALIAIQWINARRMSNLIDKTTARAVLLVFIIGGLVSTTFTDHAESLFFSWVSGLLWSSLPRKSSA